MTIDDAITRGRSALALLLRDTARIRTIPLSSDNRGGQTQGTPTLSGEIPCNIQAGLSAEEQALADRLGVAVAYIIRLPAGTAVSSANQIVVGSRTFEVVTPLTTTIALTLRVLCKELT